MTLVTGLHIGGSTDSFDIGGADSGVIKNPLDNQPYVPGSSIKGKVRSLLSRKYGEIVENKEIKLENDVLRNLFEPVIKEGEFSETRALFRDAKLTKNSVEQLQMYLGEGVFTEIKAENSINSLTSKAANPRFIERVPAGAQFEGQIVLQIFEEDNEKEMCDFLKEGLQLLEINYLGASGSRGYGRIQLNTLDFEEVDF